MSIKSKSWKTEVKEWGQAIVIATLLCMPELLYAQYSTQPVQSGIAQVNRVSEFLWSFLPEVIVVTIFVIILIFEFVKIASGNGTWQRAGIIGICGLLSAAAPSIIAYAFRLGRNG